MTERVREIEEKMAPRRIYGRTHACSSCLLTDEEWEYARGYNKAVDTLHEAMRDLLAEVAALQGERQRLREALIHDHALVTAPSEPSYYAHEPDICDTCQVLAGPAPERAAPAAGQDRRLVRCARCDALGWEGGTHICARSAGPEGAAGGATP